MSAVNFVRRSTLAASRSSSSRLASATRVQARSLVSRRGMSSSAHGEYKPTSDKPWAIGALVIFGPALLYLLSPSSRKNTNHKHSDKHDFPALLEDEHRQALTKQHEARASEKQELVKDDEGTVADVSGSVALAQSTDSPKDGQSAEKHESLKAAAESDTSSPSEPQIDAMSNTQGDKKGTFQDGDDAGPTDLGTARQAAKEGTEPKKASEAAN